MRRISLIIALIAAILIGGFLAAPWFILYAAKVRAVKQYTREPFTERTLNRVPESPPQHIAARLELSSLWMNGRMANAAWVFRLIGPSDDDPKRANAVITITISGAFFQAAAPGVCSGHEPFGFYELMILYQTSRDRAGYIPQPNMKRCCVIRFIDAKLMLAPVGLKIMPQFFRDNVKGFILGDPVRSKHVFVWVVFEDQQQFVDLGVIPEAPISMPDLEALISVMKVSSKRPKSEKDLDAQERPKELSE